MLRREYRRDNVNLTPVKTKNDLFSYTEIFDHVEAG